MPDNSSQDPNSDVEMPPIGAAQTSDEERGKQVADVIENIESPFKAVAFAFRKLGFTRAFVILSAILCTYVGFEAGKWASRDTLQSKEFLLGAKVQDIGVERIDDLTSAENVLPPDQFFKLSRSEIVINAMAAPVIIAQQSALLKSLMNKGIKVKFLLADPEENYSLITSDQTPFSYAEEVTRSLKQLVSSGVAAHPNCEIRWHGAYPHYLGLLRDINIDSTEERPVVGVAAALRYEPHLFQRMGPRYVIQVRPRSDGEVGLFDSVAMWMRSYWQSGKRIGEPKAVLKSLEAKLLAGKIGTN